VFQHCCLCFARDRLRQLEESKMGKCLGWARQTRREQIGSMWRALNVDETISLTARFGEDLEHLCLEICFLDLAQHTSTIVCSHIVWIDAPVPKPD
jgi:predicted PolB exonuclease-like 3'-5' exonuclease